jgi:Tfp pilus assembly protein PilF
LTLLAQDKKEEAKAMFEHVLRVDPKYILAQEQLNVLGKGP